jgi:hypothetical protein
MGGNGDLKTVPMISIPPKKIKTITGQILNIFVRVNNKLKTKNTPTIKKEPNIIANPNLSQDIRNNNIGKDKNKIDIIFIPL